MALDVVGNIISSGNVGIGNTLPAYTLDVTGNANVNGYIRPSAGSGDNGIIFPNDPGGGSGDIAWIKYYPITGEQTVLEIGVANNGYGSVQDCITLTTPTGVGINAIPVSPYALYISGDTYTTGGYYSGSDIRAKNNIQNADINKCYDIVKNLRLCTFYWNSNIIPNTKDDEQIGWIAQEVEEYIPNSIIQINNYGFSNFRTLESNQLNKVAYGALQKAIKTIEEQSIEINNLKTFIASKFSDYTL
jgi:hypothetical protein